MPDYEPRQGWGPRPDRERNQICKHRPLQFKISITLQFAMSGRMALETSEAIHYSFASSAILTYWSESLLETHQVSSFIGWARYILYLEKIEASLRKKHDYPGSVILSHLALELSRHLFEHWHAFRIISNRVWWYHAWLKVNNNLLFNFRNIWAETNSRGKSSFAISNSIQVCRDYVNLDWLPYSCSDLKVQST